VRGGGVSQPARGSGNAGNHGKGMAIRAGFREASGQVLMFSDADFSTPITDAAALMKAISRGLRPCLRQQGTLIFPRRNPPVVDARTMGSKTFNLVVRSLLRWDFEDTHAGSRCSRGRLRRHSARLRINRFAIDVECPPWRGSTGFPD